MSAQASLSSEQTLPEWYYVKDNQAAGPCTFDDLSRLIRDDEIDRQTLLCRSGDTDWTAAGVHANAISLFADQDDPMSDSEEPSGGLRLNDRARSKPRVVSQSAAQDESRLERPSIDTAEMMRIANRGSRADAKRASVSGPSLASVLASFELSFSVLLLLGIPVAVFGFDLPFYFTLFVWGGIVSLVGCFIFKINQFKVGFLWGVGGLLLPFVDMIFTCMHFGIIKRSFCMAMVGTAVMFGALFMLAEDQNSDSIDYESLGAQFLREMKSQWAE